MRRKLAYMAIGALMSYPVWKLCWLIIVSVSLAMGCGTSQKKPEKYVEAICRANWEESCLEGLERLCPGGKYTILLKDRVDAQKINRLRIKARCN